MTRKYPDALTLLGHAEQAERDVNLAQDAMNTLNAEFAKAKADYEERLAVARDAILDTYARIDELRSDVETLIRHNGNKPISNGMRVWMPPIQECNTVMSHEALTPEMLDLPGELRQEPVEEPKYTGREASLPLSRLKPAGGRS